MYKRQDELLQWIETGRKQMRAMSLQEQAAEIVDVYKRQHNIPRTFHRGKTYWSKKHIDDYFA